jgi:predicted  nucleic acid-binding Zn-ribbon protein
MENKTTAELLNELAELKDEDYDTGGKFEELMSHLKMREPFFQILHQDVEESLPKAWEAIQELQDEVKRLKRHKHDEKSGDVLVRI